MNWQDKINKKLEEQRNAFKESQESGESIKKIKGYAGKISSQTEAGKKQTQEFINAAHVWQKQNPDKVKEIAAIGGKAGGRKGGKARMASMTPEERSELSRYANTCMTKEKRAQIGESKKVTEESKRIKRYQEVYDTIEETDWFTPDVVLEKYQFKGTRKHTKDKVISIGMMGNILSDKRFYDSKIEKFAYQREDGKWVNSRKLLFKKKQKLSN